MRRISAAAIVALVLPAVAAGASQDVKLALVAYSTPKDAYAKIIPAFQKTSAGKGVTFSQSYGASGEQSRAVAAGLPADIVAFSLEPDITALVKKRLVSPTWNRNAYHGFVTRSVVVFAVRNGNPKKIRTWNDLVKPGVQVVTPNPFTSGGARWNVMAAYGAALRAGKKPAGAIAYLQQLFSKHVVSQDKSAREALQTFLAGRGDVLLTYENEAILAQHQNQPVFYVIPKATIRIENPVAVVSASQDKAAAQAFVKFLWSPTAQRIYGDNGYRPVVRSVIKKYSYPVRPQLFTIRYVGGWAKVEKQFFDPNTGIMARIERGMGVPTG
jgi:sulfate transport system substrate-binding protein